jgi:hypothetical protein
MPTWIGDLVVGLIVAAAVGIFGGVGWIIKTAVIASITKLDVTLSDFGKKIEDLLNKSTHNCLWISGHEKMSGEHGTAIHQHTEKLHELDHRVTVQETHCRDRLENPKACWTSPTTEERRFNERVQ